MWEQATRWESSWWGNCTNTLGEEQKQLIYADRMGLEFFHDGKSPYNIDLTGKSILDIGSGPTSLLLKGVGFRSADVVDPIFFPKWTQERYREAGIIFWVMRGEDVSFGRQFDEAWIYNVLQHTEDPELVIKNAKRAADIIRIFEWIDTPTNIGHIHTLTEAKLNKWLGGYGKVEQIAERNCFGKAYYGIFPTS
jgi:2-polyprenyl-3-methyl-5-hydroxy-6-metoxy-1,4-benzoquinol methylase